MVTKPTSKKNNRNINPLNKLSVSYPNRSPSYGRFVDLMVKGDGVYLFDSKNRKYLDANSGLWNVSLGYNNKDVVRAINAQVKQLPFVNLFNFSNPIVIQLAEKILEISSHRFERVLFTCTGSESVEVAIKTARKFYKVIGKPKKIKLATFALSYHGTTFGAMSASGIDHAISLDYEPKVPGFISLPTPICRCCPSEKMRPACVKKTHDALDSFFSVSGETLAGVIVEPVLGGGGIFSLRKEYLKYLRRLCKEFDVMLIFDEVATGFGRTGVMFSFQKTDVVPDVLCLGKGINSGYLPLGATLISKKICDALSRAQTFIEHYSTQNGNPIACASSIATIAVIEKKKLVARVSKAGAKLKKLMIERLGDHPNIFEIRGQGLMLGIELVQDKKKRIPYTPLAVLSALNSLRKNGLIVNTYYTDEGCGLCVMPSFIISDQEILTIVQKFVECFPNK